MQNVAHDLACTGACRHDQIERMEQQGQELMTLLGWAIIGHACVARRLLVHIRHLDALRQSHIRQRELRRYLCWLSLGAGAIVFTAWIPNLASLTSSSHYGRDGDAG